MNVITPLAETSETVTLSRADFERLVATVEDTIDLAALRRQEEREALKGKESARVNYLPVELVERMLAGESPVRIWREHRGPGGAGESAAGDSRRSDCPDWWLRFRIAGATR